MKKNDWIRFRISTSLKQDFVKECDKLETDQSEILTRFILGVVTNEPGVTQLLLWMFRNKKFEEKYKRGP